MEWKRLLLKPDDSILHALSVIDAEGERFAVVADEALNLLGVVTDGNIRRSLMAGIQLDAPIQRVMNPNPHTAGRNTTLQAALALMRQHSLTHLPLVNDHGTLIDVLSNRALRDNAPLPNSVVLMVGGLGSRLEDLTKDCPKPLLTIGGKPILELIVENFADNGLTNIFLAVNYLAEKIEKHFGDGSAFGVTITYLRERIPLGTVGALSLLPSMLEFPCITMNGDILARFNPRILLNEHMKQQAAATMAVWNYEIQIPFGVCNHDENGAISGMTEKPSVQFPISAGINVFSAEVLNYLHHEKYCDVPDVIQRLLSAGHRISSYKIEGYWLDVGRITDYRKANRDAEQIFGDA
jgi:dTDP-glucose pyrophosphorylase